MAVNQQVRVAVIAVQFDPVAVSVFLNLEGGVVVDTWKEATAQSGSQSPFMKSALAATFISENGPAKSLGS